MKDGRWLAYRNLEEESDYWEVSEITAEIKNGWYWTTDIEHAKCFMDYQDFWHLSAGSFRKALEL